MLCDRTQNRIDSILDNTKLKTAQTGGTANAARFIGLRAHWTGQAPETVLCHKTLDFHNRDCDFLSPAGSLFSPDQRSHSHDR